MNKKLSVQKLILFFGLFLIGMLNACGQQDSAVSIADTSLYKYRYNQIIDYSYEPQTFTGYSFDLLYKEAIKHIGTPYKAQGKQPGGFDCSGFAFYLFKNYGIYLPYYSSQMTEIGERVSIYEAKPGDLILFKGSDLNSTQAGHVGIVVSKPTEPLKFIHSSSSRGIRFDFYKGHVYFEPRFLSIRRIVE
jgi:hypothetical protein